MYVRTKFGHLADDELLHLVSNLESPLVKELAQRLDNALDKVFYAINVSTDTIENIRSTLEKKQTESPSLEEMVNDLLDKYEELSKTFKMVADKTSAGLQIDCPGCLHTFKVKLELEEKEKEEEQ